MASRSDDTKLFDPDQQTAEVAAASAGEPGGGNVVGGNAAGAAAGAPTAPAAPGARPRTPSRRTVERLIERNPRARGLAYAAAVVIIVAALPVAYLAWWKLIPAVWHWSNEAWYHWFGGVFAMLFLVGTPIYPLMYGSRLFNSVAEISLATEVDGAFDTLHRAERKFLAAEDIPDPAGLLPLVKYSRAQLEVYYKLGLSQTRWSFAFSVVAMWIGFVFIIGGFLIYVGPAEEWFGVVRPEQDISILILAGGAIIEFVSALFLWVYRSTIGQMTFFYRRQIYAHNVMMCFRIADTMLDADETKKMIVAKFLDLVVAPERPAREGGKGMLGLLKK